MGLGHRARAAGYSNFLVKSGGVKCTEFSGLLDFDQVSLKGGGNLPEEIGSLLHDKDLDARLPRALALGGLLIFSHDVVPLAAGKVTADGNRCVIKDLKDEPKGLPGPVDKMIRS